MSERRNKSIGQRMRGVIADSVKGLLFGNFDDSASFLSGPVGLTSPVDLNNPASFTFRPGTFGGAIDYAREAGDPQLSSVVMACVSWLQRNFPDAQALVEQTDGKIWTPNLLHPMTQKIARPNQFYSGALLWQATILSYYVNGNAYWIKVRNNSGNVVELWYEPHFSIRVIGGAMPNWIDHYQVYRAGVWKNVSRADVVHFRNGLDPHNLYYGLGSLASALREIYTDNEAASFSASVLRNMGIVGMVVSPKGENATISNPDALKQIIMSKTQGDQRGEPLILSEPIDVAWPRQSPADIDVAEIRRKPEERIPALLNLHPSVPGLGAGLDRSTFSNMAEAYAAAWRNNLIPTQSVLADELDVQLLPDFGDPNKERTTWDYKNVYALKEGENDIVTRQQGLANIAAILAKGQIVTLNESRAIASSGVVKLDPRADGDVFIIPPQVGAAVARTDGSAPSVGETVSTDAAKSHKPAMRQKALPGLANTQKRFQREIDGVLKSIYQQAIDETIANTKLNPSQPLKKVRAKRTRLYSDDWLDDDQLADHLDILSKEGRQ